MKVTSQLNQIKGLQNNNCLHKRFSMIGRRTGEASICEELDETCRGLKHLALVIVGHRIEERQAQQAVAEVFGDGAVPCPAAEAGAELGEVQRQVVEDGVDVSRFEMGDERLALFEAGQQQVIHVPGLLAVRRHHGLADAAGSAPIGQLGVITLPDLLAAFLNDRPHVELRIEEGGEHVAHHITAAHIDPGIFINLAAEEAGAVGALLANDFGSLGILRVIDQQRTAFPAGDVFGLVKALRGHAAQRAEPAAFVFAEQTMRVVLHDRHAMLCGDSKNGIHLAGDSCVMHRHDGLRAWRDEGFELRLVEVQRVRPHIAKDGLRTAHDEGIRRGDKGEGRHDDLIASLDAEEDGGHFERVRAGSGHEGFFHAQRRFEKLVALA